MPSTSFQGIQRCPLVTVVVHGSTLALVPGLPGFTCWIKMETTKLEQFFADHWSKTVERCETSLEPPDLRRVRNLGSWDEVQKQVLDRPEHRTSRIPHEITLLKPVLEHLNAFTDFFERRLGPNLNAGFLWGTVGALLQLASDDPVALSKVPRMIKSIGYKTEAFNGYCPSTGDIHNRMKEACFDIQIQLVEFFTDAINTIRGEFEKVRDAQDREKEETWLLLERRYTTVNQGLIETVARIETLPDIGAKNQVSSTEDQKPQEQKFRCLMLPQARPARFFDRVEIFAKIDQVLRRAPTGMTFGSVALFGLGGVGKSSIAATYAERKFDAHEYDAVLWVHGETAASMRQSFTDIAMRCELRGAKPQNHDDNLILVQDWFQSTDCRWLVVYDNVASSDLLMPYWPRASHGKAIITTRNHSLAFEPAGAGLEVSSWDAQTGSEFLLFLLKTGIGRDLEAEAGSALKLSEQLSGHALALSHMAGLIHRRSWSVSEFMGVYAKNPRRAHRQELQALWDFSFQSLEKHSFLFLGIMSYLMPDNVPQMLFDIEDASDLPEELEFFSDDFSFSEAAESLLTLALINRDRDTRVFSIHRVVQAQFRYYLAPEKQQEIFDAAVTLVYRAFPKQGAVKAQLYDQWTMCNFLMQHVIHLKDCFKEQRKNVKNFKVSWEFCQLLQECQRYLQETNALDDLKDMCEVNLDAVTTLDDEAKSTHMIAYILSHQALMYESIGHVEHAIELNKKTYELRLTEVPLKENLLAAIENNLAFTHNTANDHETALEWFRKSRDRSLSMTADGQDEPVWPHFAKANMGRCLLYLNRLTEARDLLNISIAAFKEETPLDWAMIAYAYFALGTLDRREGNTESGEAHFIEAQNLWLEGDHTRLHPFNGGCLYKIGVCCLDQGKIEAAIKHLRDSIEVTAFHKDSMPVEHARNLFKLSEALIQDDHHRETEARESREEAAVYLARRKPDMASSDSEDDYDRLIPIFWR